MKEKVEDYFPSKYLKADDVKGEQAVTISKVEEEKIGEDIKPVVYFEETDKGLVLNKTNANKIAKATGSEKFADWAGHKITLYTVVIPFRGEDVPAIRVKKFDALAS